MNRILQRLAMALTLLLSAIVTHAAVGESFDDGIFGYTVTTANPETGTYEVAVYNCNSSIVDVQIPASVDYGDHIATTVRRYISDEDFPKAAYFNMLARGIGLLRTTCTGILM